MAEPAPDKLESLSFEEAYSQLGEIVDALDSDRGALEDLVVQYERGMQLLQVCQHRLESARQRVEMISVKNQPASAKDASESRRPRKPKAQDDLQLL